MKRKDFLQALLLGAVVCVSACSSDEAALEGKRLSVLTYGSELMPDSDLKSHYLIPEPESVQS